MSEIRINQRYPRHVRMEKSHLYKNCVVVRCPLTEGTMMTGSVKKVAKWARQNSYILMDFRKPVETL